MEYQRILYKFQINYIIDHFAYTTHCKGHTELFLGGTNWGLQPWVVLTPESDLQICHLVVLGGQMPQVWAGIT